LSDYSDKDFRQVFGLVSVTCVAYYSPLPDPKISAFVRGSFSHTAAWAAPDSHRVPYSPEHALRHRKCAQHIGVHHGVSTHI
jgi:hypothetical protein